MKPLSSSTANPIRNLSGKPLLESSRATTRSSTLSDPVASCARKFSLDLTRIKRLPPHQSVGQSVRQCPSPSLTKCQPDVSLKNASQDVPCASFTEEKSSTERSAGNPTIKDDLKDKGKRHFETRDIILSKVNKRQKNFIENDDLNFVVGEPIAGSELEDTSDVEQEDTPMLKSSTTKEILVVVDNKISSSCLSFSSSTGSQDDYIDEAVTEDSSVDVTCNTNNNVLSTTSSTLLPVVSVENVTDLSQRQVDSSARSDTVNCRLSGSGSDTGLTDRRCENRVVGLVVEHGENHYHMHQRFFPERPQRIQAILDHLRSSEVNLLNKCAMINDHSASNKDLTVSSQAQTFLNDDDFLRVHLPGYMSRLTMLGRCKCQERLDGEACQYTSIYLTPDSIQQAKQAASSLCQLVENVMKGKQDNGFAIIRPPGHHAEPGTMSGFCIINNIAVAASYAKTKLGASKILIVDWDVHHGNGTQKMFLNDPNVLYFSVHRYDGANFFPHSKAGAPSQIGEGKGEGYNVNVGWSSRRGGMGDAEYVAVWHALLLPIARQFQPDLILISAGFDAAEGDLGECCVTPECFAALTKPLLELPSATGRVVCALEGGYNRKVLSSCVEHVLRALLEKGSSVQSLSSDEAAGEDGYSPDFSLFYSFAQRILEIDDYSHSSAAKKVLDRIQSKAAADIRQTISFHSKHWNLKVRS